MDSADDLGGQDWLSPELKYLECARIEEWPK